MPWDYDEWGEWVEIEEKVKPALWQKHASPEKPQKKSQGKHELKAHEQLRGALRGARKGGMARKQKLSPAQRTSIARKAAIKRWSSNQLTKGSS